MVYDIFFVIGEEVVGDDDDVFAFYESVDEVRVDEISVISD